MIFVQYFKGSIIYFRGTARVNASDNVTEGSSKKIDPGISCIFTNNLR